jgi:hypothetical protein
MQRREFIGLIGGARAVLRFVDIAVSRSTAGGGVDGIE